MTMTKELKKKAKKIRLAVLEAAYLSKRAHIGSTFSVCDILVALFYRKFININPSNIKKSSRDKFILSKGHACLALYAIYKDIGIISKKQYESYGKNGGLGGQLDYSIAGVDFNTGSLGHAVGVASGMALSDKLSGTNHRVFVVLGDSELFEGSVWEGIIFAGDNKLNNLICIVDRNKFMASDKVEENVIYSEFKTKIKSFGWNYLEMKGHDFFDIESKLLLAKKSKQPTMVIANTIKGRGVSFMENGVGWYTQTPSEDEFLKAKLELENE